MSVPIWTSNYKWPCRIVANRTAQWFSFLFFTFMKSISCPEFFHYVRCHWFFYKKVRCNLFYNLSCNWFDSDYVFSSTWGGKPVSRTTGIVTAAEGKLGRDLPIHSRVVVFGMLDVYSWQEYCLFSSSLVSSYTKASAVVISLSSSAVPSPHK